MRRFFAFVREVYAPGLHFAFAAAWFLALAYTIAPKLRVGVALEALIVLGFVLLFFLRVVDEWKDADYDRVHNPDRPLARGLVTLRDLRVYLAASALVSLAIGAALGPRVLALAALDIVWALALVGLERASARVREGMLLNLLVTYPVNVILSVMVAVCTTEHARAALDGRALVAIVAFALAFLHFEVARKTAWPEAAAPGERLYSRALGAPLAITIATVLALGAVALAAVAVDAASHAARAAVLIAPLVPPLLAMRKFFRARGERVRLRPLGMLFLTLFYVALIAQRLLPQ